MMPLLTRVEHSALATAIGQSTLVTGLLSGVHLIGLTLIVGASLVSGMRLLGWLLADYPVADVAGGARRVIATGLLISVTSGLLLVAPRSTIASVNGVFQVKMLLLAAAAVFHFAIQRRAASGDPAGFFPAWLAGALGLALWVGVVLAGCAFILLE